ncbi:hypothetical protein SD37_07410 [Amycolatopsis orientalis]|uniref:Small secreted protein n=1 Tax=Amycolatopsis orientalis TaxID=31958 RepID=A0A193BTG2_AMYOR|nr:hypothetical protein [Amycolatopsis orientalis]ANN15501.1 hypothetical protein SD37_07410 [Amycolatopsis orientalis]
MKTKLLLVSLIGALSVVTACSGEAPQAAPATVTVTPSSPAPTSPAGPDSKTVAWLDGMCGALFGYIKASNDYASKQGSGVEVTRSWLSEDLGVRAGLAGKVVDELATLPASPIPGGDAAKKSTVDRFVAARDAAAEGKRKLDASKSKTALDQGLKALEAAQKPLTETTDPFANLKMDSPELLAAAAAAKKCAPSS